MKCAAFIVSDGISHGVFFLKRDVEQDENGNDTIAKSSSYRTIGSPTREDAVKVDKRLATIPYTSTGQSPAKGSLVIVGAFGVEPTPPLSPAKAK